MTLVKRVIYRQKGEEVIKLVKFLLLIVLIAPTYAWGCITQTTENACGMKTGCKWDSVTNQCTECDTGYHSPFGSTTCSPCTNGPDGAEYLYKGKENGDYGKCPWLYTCDTNEQVNCTQNGNKWTCSCETCTAGKSFEFYYYSDDQTYPGDSSCTGANIVVLRMPTNYDAFPTEEDGYLFFSKTENGVEVKDGFSLGINVGTACDTVPDLEIINNGYGDYEWSWKNRSCSDRSGDVADCEVGDWKREDPTCELFKGDGALNYPFAWESKERLRPTRYYVKKGNDIIDIFTLVTDENKALLAPTVQYNTFYAFADYFYRLDNWEKLFDCGNPPDGKCIYNLYADDWQPWPYTNFVIYFGDEVLIENAGTEGYWNIGLGFNFNEAFTYCEPGEYLPSKVIIEDEIENATWRLEATIPDGGDLKIVPPYGRNFTGFLKIDAEGTNDCPEGYYCNECSKNKCPTAFTSQKKASEAQHCYIKPNVKFTDSSGMGFFSLPSCNGIGCVGGKIKVNYNPDLKLQ